MTPYLRNIAWLVVLLLNAAIGATIAPTNIAVDAGVAARRFFALNVCMFPAIAALLVLARLSRLPRWGSPAMCLLCIGLPVLWMLGSLDYGTLSDLETAGVILMASLAWGTWRVFKLFP